MKDFENKTAVVTGAASGIGQCIAEYCAIRKMKIVLADIDENALVSLKDKLAEDGIQVHAVPTDVSKLEDIQSLADQTLEHFSSVDLLFNNAGVAAGSTLWESSLQDCQWVFGVNLWGVMHGIRTFVPIMIEQNSPCHIVNTSSIAGVCTYHPSSLYNLTKHSVVALSEQLYHDLKIRKTKIDVSVLCPGFVNTNFMETERHRPDRFKNDNPEQNISPEMDEMGKAFIALLENGMSPADVARITFDAIENARFYIFTHPELMDFVRLRMGNLLEGKNPELPPPPM